MKKYVKLTPDLLRELFRYEPKTGMLYWRDSGFEAGRVDACGRRRLSLFGNRYFAHQLVWFMHHRRWPARHARIIHLNRWRDDNRIENLREVSGHQKEPNRIPRPKSDPRRTGVLQIGENLWRTVIWRRDEKVYFATFSTKEAAQVALQQHLRFHVLAKKSYYRPPTAAKAERRGVRPSRPPQGVMAGASRLKRDVTGDQ